MTTKKTSGLLDRKKGNFVPTAKEEKTDDKTVLPNFRNLVAPGLAGKTHSVKVPNNLKEYMDGVKKIKGIKYDYELMAFLMDSLVENMDSEDKERFTKFMQI